MKKNKKIRKRIRQINKEIKEGVEKIRDLKWQN